VKDVPKNANLKIWCGAWRKGVSWNHAKIIAIDGQYLLEGGHNLWDDHYLKVDPVRDLSTEAEGAVTVDAHFFVNEMWKYIMKKDRQSCGFHIVPVSASFLKGFRVGVARWPSKVDRHPPMYSLQDGLDPALPSIPLKEAKANGQLAMIPVGRHGALNIEDTIKHTVNPADAAIVAMLGASHKIVRMSLQDLGPLAIPGLGGPSPIPGGVWPKAYLHELGKAIAQRGVDVEIVLSGPNFVPGGLSPLVANYGNGWTCNDVACEIIKEVRNSTLVLEVEWSASWRSSMEKQLQDYRESSDEAAAALLTVRTVHSDFLDILDGSGNLYDEEKCQAKCGAFQEKMFPLKVCIVLGEARLRELISENLRVTYMRSTGGLCDSNKNRITGNHAKFFMVDDVSYYIGSQNLYIANLAEWGIIVDDEAQTKKVIAEYWEPVWQSSYSKDTLDCDVDAVIRGLDIDRNGPDPATCSPDVLAAAEQARRAKDGGGTAEGKCLAVLVKSASNLKKADTWSNSDPYCELLVQDSQGLDVAGHLRTTVQQDNLNPVWNQILVFEGLLHPRDYTLKIHMWDEDNTLGMATMAADDDLGTTSVPLSGLQKTNEFQDMELKFEDCAARLHIAVNTMGAW
jgi:hypothetical protein